MSLPTSAPRWCPVCLQPVTYVAHRRGAWWVHAESGHFMSTLPNQHDVNTYSPHQLLTEPPSVSRETSARG